MKEGVSLGGKGKSICDGGEGASHCVAEIEEAGAGVCVRSCDGMF